MQQVLDWLIRISKCTRGGTAGAALTGSSSGDIIAAKLSRRSLRKGIVTALGWSLPCKRSIGRANLARLGWVALKVEVRRRVRRAVGAGAGRERQPMQFRGIWGYA